tara:strand:- start:159 stop:1226 length:1068 start_codon:yes stop_codon:yes gene_type:complete
MGIFDWLFGKKETTSNDKKEVNKPKEEKISETPEELKKTQKETNTESTEKVEETEVRILLSSLEKNEDYEMTYQGKLFSGIGYQEWSPNGQVQSEEVFVNGSKNGFDRRYRDDGKLEIESFYKDNRRTGLCKCYDLDGNLDLIIPYKNGEYHGTEEEWKDGRMIRKNIYENGTLLNTYEIDENGNQIERFEKENKVIIRGGDNMSGYNDCNVEVVLKKEELLDELNEQGIEIQDFDGDLWIGSVGETIEFLERYSKEECVLVTRFQIFDKEGQIYYEIIETETVNSSKPNEELNKTYYKKGHVNHPDPVEYNEMVEKEIEEFNENWEYNGDNRYFGYDVYTIEKFDLKLELETGY